MGKNKKYIIWIFNVIAILVLFIPKGAIKNYISLALLIIIAPFLIIGIIKRFKENSKQTNNRIITDIVFISLIMILFYLIRQSEF
jgi:hypothetical protein